MSFRSCLGTGIEASDGLINIWLTCIAREDAAPEIPEDEFEPWVQVESKHNTPIEGFWPWLREGEGHNIRNVILSGAAKFNCSDPLHV